MKIIIPEMGGNVKEEKPKSNAEIFVEAFSPYRKKYIYRKAGGSLFDGAGFSTWQTANSYLTDSKIEQSIIGKTVIGYFLASCTSCFCVDLDDHTSKGWGYLLSIYDIVSRNLNVYASMLCKTPRGLHAFYFLTHPVPEVLLIERARHALEGVPVEVKPTMQIGLRIPAEQYLLNPQSLDRLGVDFTEAVKRAAKYHPFEIFGAPVMSDEIVDSLKNRKSKVLRIKVWETICKFESKYACDITAGTTNEALCELIPIYRSGGLTPEEASAEFAALLAPEYAGELRNYRRLLRRVQSFYKKTPATRFNTLSKLETDLFTELIIENITMLVTGAKDTRQQKAALTQRKRTVKKAILTIESWKRYINMVNDSKQFLEMWNYLYPYFKKNVREGFYPLSSDILKKIHKNYERLLLPFLIEIGYLERSPYEYSSVYGICYYYKIHSSNFTSANSLKPAPTARIRPGKAKLRREEIKAYQKDHPQASIRDIAQAMNVSKSSVHRCLSGKRS